MSERLQIAFTDAEGAIVRILGAVERRGYRLGAIVRDGGGLTLDLTARDPGRRLDVLAAQLRRLHDVGDVTLIPISASEAA